MIGLDTGARELVVGAVMDGSEQVLPERRVGYETLVLAIGSVFWHPRDASGANWGVDIANGTGDFDGCLDCVAAAREQLRRLYAIVDEH
jgi:hypothetical protein